ncbi:MAG: hypothetical protein FJX25_00675 [Alphaproteobacteria bacterium]|nr:hypothetical protein [Alphaproteobacteria bacterium]
MARERIKVTRADSTGFDEVVKPVRDRSDYTTLKVDAIEAFENKRKASDKGSKTKDQSQEDEVSAKADTGSVEIPKPATHVPDESEDKASLSQPAKNARVEAPTKPKGSDNVEADTEANTLLDLALPPRRRADGYINLSLRLRVLERHVDALKSLEDNGIDVSDVFRVAYRSLPTVDFSPHYVPQVAEPSGPGKYAYRVRPAVRQQTISAIEKQVRGGANASRASLLLGQIEPAWFAKLDLVIKEFTK